MSEQQNNNTQKPFLKRISELEKKVASLEKKIEIVIKSLRK